MEAQSTIVNSAYTNMLNAIIVVVKGIYIVGVSRRLEQLTATTKEYHKGIAYYA